MICVQFDNFLKLVILFSINFSSYYLAFVSRTYAMNTFRAHYNVIVSTHKGIFKRLFTFFITYFKLSWYIDKLYMIVMN